MDPSLIYTVDVARLSQQAGGLPREAIRVATLFDGKRKLWEVLRDSFLTSRMTMSIFGRLKELDLVGVANQEPAPKPEPLPEPASTPDVPNMDEEILGAAPEPQIQAAPEPVIQAAPEPVTPPTLTAEEAADTIVTVPLVLEAVDAPEDLEVQPPVLEAAEAPDTVVSEPPTAAREDFDEADRAFFDSYVPEDSTVDTFYDLEENPRKMRAGRALQRRLNRRSRGWFASLIMS